MSLERVDVSKLVANKAVGAIRFDFEPEKEMRATGRDVVPSFLPSFLESFLTWQVAMMKPSTRSAEGSQDGLA